MFSITSPSGQLHVFWVMCVVPVLFFIVMSVLYGSRDKPYRSVFWRTVQVASASLGFVGFGLLLLNYETLLRTAIVDDAKHVSLLNFLQAKLFVQRELAIACSLNVALSGDNDMASRCLDMRNIDAHLATPLLYKNVPFGQVTDWQRNPATDTIVEEVNGLLAQIDRTIEEYPDKPTFSYSTRVVISALTALLIGLGLAGSLGEAIFQMQQAMSERRKIKRNE
jgi:hypothetical protein